MSVPFKDLVGYEKKKSSILNYRTTRAFSLNKITGLIPIIPTYAGMTTELLDMLDLKRIDGLVIEAFGLGIYHKKWHKSSVI